MDAEEQYQKGLAVEAAAEQEEKISHQQASILRDQAADFWKEAAEQGHAKAQYKLGFYFYTYSRKSTKDNRAFFWYSQAAEQGDADAQYELGFLYGYGLGTLRDIRKSRCWFEKAAMQGHAGAALILGERCEEKTHNYKKAADWYMKAAQYAQCPISAEFHLGTLYEKKLNDPLKAAAWYRKAAEHGFDSAQLDGGVLLGAQAAFNLGAIYELSLNDFDQAVEWYRKAAEHGSSDAEAWMNAHGLATSDRLTIPPPSSGF